MNTVVELREPFRSWFAQLDLCHFGVSSGSPGRIEFGGWYLSKMPELDADDARALAAELEAAIAPVMKRFKARKMAEVLALMKGNADPNAVMVVR